MKTSAVSISYKRTFNLGDYNSLGLACTIWADLDEEDVSQDVIDSLQDQARESVKKEYSRLEKKITPVDTVPS